MNGDPITRSARPFAPGRSLRVDVTLPHSLIAYEYHDTRSPPPLSQAKSYNSNGSERTCFAHRFGPLSAVCSRLHASARGLESKRHQIAVLQRATRAKLLPDSRPCRRVRSLTSICILGPKRRKFLTLRRATLPAGRRFRRTWVTFVTFRPDASAVFGVIFCELPRAREALSAAARAR